MRTNRYSLTLKHTQMSLVMLFLLPFTSVATAYSQNVFLSGMLDQSYGMAVICVTNGKASELAHFNELRPPSIKTDWTRSFIGLQPIMVSAGYLYYYLPSHSTQPESKGAIFRRKPDSAPELICETPLLTTVCKRADYPQIVAVTKDEKIVVVDMITHSTRQLNLDRNFTFASWTRDGNTIVASTSQNAEIVSIDATSGSLEMDQLIDKSGSIRRVYATTNSAEYLIQYGAEICVFNSSLKRLRSLRISQIPLASDLLYCESSGVAYVLVPDDNDGRTLIILDLATGKTLRSVEGVFDDNLIGD